MTNRTQESNAHRFEVRARDEDYEDPEVDGIENVYHILEGLTPEREEYDENEPNAYEVPVIKN